MANSFSTDYLSETHRILAQLDTTKIEQLVEELGQLRARRGRLFVLGVGGSAANASHAVNDFRKIANIEAYAPTDNVAELTARTNDEGWRWTFDSWLSTSHLSGNDAIFILSVGGGSDYTSPNLLVACRYARLYGAQIFGIVGRDGGYVAQCVGTTYVLVPPIFENHITPHTEEIQSILLHLLVTHPRLQL